jgi:DNA-binding NarL/FixJ family response regulator
VNFSELEKEKIQILVVDDHPLLRLGVVSMIKTQKDMIVVGQAGSVAEAVVQFRKSKPGLVLMDLRLSDGSGVEAIRQIKYIDKTVRICVFTTYEGDEDIHRALEAGAQSYLIKGMPHQSLLRAIRKVYAGEKFLPPTVSDALSSRIPSLTLTEREREVLVGMFGGRSNREIAGKLQIGETTVKTHVSGILTKLNVEDRTQAVVEALKKGLIHL